MPFYEVRHVYPLTLEQKDAIAAAIVQIHSEAFVTPKLFVNVAFINIAEGANNGDFYVAGKRHRSNFIAAHVRPGPSRTHQDWENLCRAVIKAWDEIVNPGGDSAKTTTAAAANGTKEAEENSGLSRVFLLGSIIGGFEAGFVLPKAGEDAQWLQSNWAEMKARAAAGDQDLIDMVEEVRARGLVKE